MRTVSWLRRLVAGHSTRRSGFDLRSIYVRFVVSSVELRQVSFQAFLFTPDNIIPTLLHADFHLYILVVFRNTDERSQGNIQTPILIRKFGERWLKSTLISLTFPRIKEMDEYFVLAIFLLLLSFRGFILRFLRQFI